MLALGDAAGLELRRQENFSFVMYLEGLLGGSFPKLGDAGRIRALFEEAIHAGGDSPGVAARRGSSASPIRSPSWPGANRSVGPVRMSALYLRKPYSRCLR
jgi:hypothetical protein